MSYQQADAVKSTEALDIPSRIRRSWADALSIPESGVESEKSFFELGGFSILAITLAGEIGSDLGVALPASAILSNNTLRDFTAYVESLMAGESAADSATQPSMEGIVPEDGVSFPLSELQQGYWVGENGSLELSGPAFFYGVYKARSLDVSALENALNALFNRHEMFRAVFTGDGRQRVLQEVPHYRVKHIDSRGASEAGFRNLYRELRNDIIDNQGGLAEWPLFHVTVLETDSGSYVFNFGKLIITDGRSGEILAADLLALMNGSALPEIRTGFQAYMRALERFKESPKYLSAIRYWKSKARELPGPPELPLAISPEAAAGAKAMTRRSILLDKAAWQGLKALSRRFGITPSMAMCSAYCSVLAYWSKTSRFTINVMYANRPQIHPDVNNIIGNFSNTVLLGYDASQGGSFLARTMAMQADFFQSLEHGFVSGVTAIREINAQGNGSKPFMVPYVFASGLGLGGEEDAEEPLYLEKLGWEHVESGIHTPQVILDHQVAENAGRLQLNWDSKDHLMPEGLVQTMFDAYVALLRKMAQDPAIWDASDLDLLPEEQKRSRLAYNGTSAALTNCQSLFQGFVDIAKKTPDAIAVLEGSQSISYGRLWNASLVIASAIMDRGGEGVRMAPLILDKGWKQVAAAIGILLARGAYVPIPASSPDARAKSIMSKFADPIIVTSGSCGLGARLLKDHAGVDLDRLDLTGDTAGLRLPEIDPEGLAYVIFTSGSTGVPKGVAVSHRSALNTILDLNGRYSVTSSDIILGLSELSFDLSVYDIFGILTAGGSLVLPEEEHIRNPFYLSGLVEKNRVTIWNSVPAFAEMVCEAAGTMKSLPLQSLRLILMSGDWIPVHLPGQLRAQAQAARLISLGGATEAAIWSIHFEIGDVDPEWKSIPYGYPLANQKMYVLDDNLQDRPDSVPGDICIGGIGLAEGYYGDAERTGASFFVNPHTGERVYRTGDKGRFRKDGWMEFLGREDAQVKVRGYRIELGEIESAVRGVSGVKECLCMVTGSGNRKQIAAYMIGGAADLDLNRLNAELAGRIPSYMLPNILHRLASFPLTPNGKVDRKALESFAADRVKAAPEGPSGLTPLEATLLKIFRRETGNPSCRVTDGFFDLGGNSISAVRIINEINSITDKQLPLGILYEHPSARKLAAKVEAWHAIEWQSIINISVHRRKRAVLCIHPIGGNVLCYASISRMLAPGFDVYGAQARGLHADLPPHRTIGEMASYYCEKSKPLLVDYEEIILLGWSMGGLIALEMAGCPVWKNQLKEVILIDTKVRKDEFEAGAQALGPAVLREFFKDLCGGNDVLDRAVFSSSFLKENIVEAIAIAESRSIALNLDPGTVLSLFRLYESNLAAILSHTMRDPGVPARLFEADSSGGFAFFQTPGPRHLDGFPSLKRERVEGADHYSILSDRHFASTAFDAFRAVR